MTSPELHTNHEAPGVIFFVEYYECPDSLQQPPKCHGRISGDTGLVIGTTTGSPMMDYGAAFQEASKNTPECPNCDKKTIPHLSSRPSSNQGKY